MCITNITIIIVIISNTNKYNIVTIKMMKNLIIKTSKLKDLKATKLNLLLKFGQ